MREYILPPNGRPSSLMLNSIVFDSVSEECSRCSLIAHTRTDAKSTPQAWKSVPIFWMDRVLRTTLKTIFFTAFISFLLKSTAVSLERCKQIQIFSIEGKLILWSTIMTLSHLTLQGKSKMEISTDNPEARELNNVHQVRNAFTIQSCCSILVQINLIFWLKYMYVLIGHTLRIEIWDTEDKILKKMTWKNKHIWS